VRDPKRINIVLDVIRGIWNKYPDLRLTQLIINAVHPIEDPFYIEDDILIEKLKKYPKKTI